jgi:hypothetical protein
VPKPASVQPHTTGSLALYDMPQLVSQGEQVVQVAQGAAAAYDVPQPASLYTGWAAGIAYWGTVYCCGAAYICMAGAAA